MLSAVLPGKILIQEIVFKRAGGIKFFKDRFFFEPAIGISYWPVRTNVPESFKAVEQKWPNYFIQPGLDFGFNF